MKYNFDEWIDRRNTNSLKYDFARERGMPEGLLPLWVADMDFRAPPTVTEALVRAAKHGIFGYSDSKEDYFAVLRDWFVKHYCWTIKPDWLVKTPGVVFAIANAIRALTQPGEAVMIQQPVYYPFAGTVKANNRELVNNELIYDHGIYSIDFADFETKIRQHQVRLFLLCSPHNPVGRVWREDGTSPGSSFVLQSVQNS